MNKKISLFLLIISLSASYIMLSAQSVSKVWVSDLVNGTYKNPVLYADYSDPDVCRAGNDYYMVASSFANIP